MAEKEYTGEEIKNGEAVENATASQEGTEDSNANAETGENAETDEEAGADVKNCLVATYPILYLSHQYKVGDTLPANNPDMVEAWIAAGTAVWIDDEKQGISKVKAGAQTAETGLAGTAG